MSRNLQFAFLGPHNSYLASVTRVNQSGCPLEDAPTIAYSGLPADFVTKYHKFARNKYIYNVRGHDCFAFLGEWTKETTRGQTSSEAELLAEMAGLQKLANDNMTNQPPYRKEDMLISLGAAPGSFFADAYRLRRYKWCNLPLDLEDEIQKEVCRRGYGTIYDVAVNASSGWIMQFDRGRSYRWGGDLPLELKAALDGGRTRRATIRQLYLNPQNKQDYVLIFTDAHAHLSLHHGIDIEPKIRTLVQSTFSASKKLHWTFINSCCCNIHSQNALNAAYYSQRGHFQLRRPHPNRDLVLTYLREAHHLVPSSPDYRDDYYMALLAAHGQNHAADANHLTRFDSQNASRNEFAFMRDRMGSLEALQDRLTSVLRDASKRQLTEEWKFETAVQGVVELPVEVVEETTSPSYELGDRENREAEMSADMASVRVGSRRAFRFWR
ncbi:hypothetical protein EJ04DRAFT_554339 [Polyplosphaeria fusca]|uniref:Uncharacterized protein n=1 Tax=Polyplosphaeria fusca TaxID=682080 RepID=A0A9P4QVV6_9PLEO|nr:hypothetical protein EJ04DRAFT_554339 [Polyplosphaeria fusca]